MQYPFWYVLAHWRGDQYDLTPLYIGGYRIMVYTVVQRAPKLCIVIVIGALKSMDLTRSA